MNTPRIYVGTTGLKINYTLPPIHDHNVLLLALIEAINSDLDYKLTKISCSSLSNYSLDTWHFRGDHINCYARMCNKIYRFQLREEEIIVLQVVEDDHNTMAECTKIRLLGELTDNDIYMAKGFFKLQELLNGTDSSEDSLLCGLTEIVSNLIDSKVSGHNIQISEGDNVYFINFGITYPKYINRSNGNYRTCRHKIRCDKVWHVKEQSRRLVCMRYGKTESGGDMPILTRSVSYNIDDPRVLKKIVKWLSNKKYLY